MRPSAWCSFCLQAGVLWIASSAHADAKTYPGAMCRPSVMAREEAPTDLFRATPPSSGGPAGGYTALQGYLDCPIVRDVTQNTDGLAGAQVRLVAGDASAESAECVLTSLSEDGRLLDTETRNTKTTGVLDFGDSLDVSDALGYYHLFCRLPPRWTLMAYTIQERGSGRDDAPGVSAAEDMKYYNAAEWCYPSERTATAQNGFFGYPPDGYTTTTPTVCPIIRDDNSSSRGLRGVRVNLLGPENTSATCTLYSVTSDGNSVQSATLSSAEGGAVTLEFGEMPGSTTASTSAGDASYYFYCSFGDIGGQFWIIKGYRVLEWASED
jgi:hypothetical protein